MIKIFKKYPEIFRLRLLVIVLAIIVVFILFMTAGRKIVYDRVGVGRRMPLHISKRLERNEEGKWEFVVSLKNTGWKRIDFTANIREDSIKLDTLQFSLCGGQKRILKAPLVMSDSLVYLSANMKNSKEDFILSPHSEIIFDCIDVFYYSNIMGLEWSDWFDFYGKLPPSVSYLDEYSIIQLFPSKVSFKHSFFKKQTEMIIFVGFPDALFDELQMDTIITSLAQWNGSLQYRDEIFSLGEKCPLILSRGEFDSIKVIFNSPSTAWWRNKGFCFDMQFFDLPTYHKKETGEIFKEDFSYCGLILYPPRLPFVPRFLGFIKRQICYFIH